MNKIRFCAAVLGVLLVAALAGAADFKKDIVGSWQMDMGGGFTADVQYSANGRFVQDMKGMSMKGTYSVKGNVLTTVVNGKKTDLTIVSCDAKKMTQKRADGKTMSFTRK